MYQLYHVPQPSLVVEDNTPQQDGAVDTGAVVPQPSLVVEEAHLQQQDAASTVTVVPQSSLVVTYE